MSTIALDETLLMAGDGDTSVALLLITIGFLFLIGLIADLAGRFTPLPRVTLLLLCGVAVGSSGLELLPAGFVDTWFPLLTNVALSIIGFLLGQKVTVSALRARGRKVLWLTFGKVMGAWLTVTCCLVLLGVDPRLALILGGIAPATAPAATYDVVKEVGATGEFTDCLLGVVAVDDAAGLLLFTFVLAGAAMFNGDDTVLTTVSGGLVELGGSALVGLVLGVPMAFMTGRIQEGEPTQAEAMGLVLLCAGLALHFGFSPILSSMVMGATVASFAKHHTRPFHAIEGFEWPFMIFFFVLAGASLEVNALAMLGAVGGVYLCARAAGIWLGIYIIGGVKKVNRDLRNWLAPALLPQAGVALGMALLASQRFPDLAHSILTIVLASTVLLEIVAPLITRRVLLRVGAVKPQP